MPDAEPKVAAEVPAAADLEIWVVVRGNPSEKFPEGLLITTRDRMPELIAYVNRVDPPGILSAKLIASGKSSPESEENLRGNPNASERFVRALLIPMDFMDGRDRRCVAASFLKMRDETALSFVAYTSAGFEAAHKSAAESLRKQTEGKQQ